MPHVEQHRGHIIAREKLPDDYPTNAHSAQFWEELGRTVAVFGFLEEMLGKAIFALTGMKEFDPDADPDALSEWIKTLEKTLTDQLGGLLFAYKKALAENDKTKGQDYEGLIDNLMNAKDIRNVLCHGSWGKPDDQGKTLPKFVNRKLAVFETLVDIDFLRATRKAVVGLACDVLDTVTSLGFQFPGSESPGQVIWPKQMNPPQGGE
ncbi:hypothetical protein GCM10007973_31320 [Polymorphobacter multimanifer]|uniref:Uncharacterized protein n=1 Tax=Polymorphobacter multimanifer TaxID=1070431 RepID=A0A841L8I1_9SPHN|nr:hypothetical protein [Polymorphobacter multimanifer]MBB6227891.1 hypothetical protein [Polymorphobacter multimanifer]GGI92746.1 hypothetical protein GCM10007973_31320 [Polymorphobacter multimanifer]